MVTSAYWMAPATMLANAEVMNKILIAVLGWYTWECVVTSWFEIEVITLRRPFKWPMVAYWSTKFSMFWALVGLVVATNVTGHIACQPLYSFTQFVGNTAVGGASTLLMLRVIAIWSRNPYVMYPLVTLSVGQWAILLHEVSSVRAVFSAAAGGCVVSGTPNVFLQLIYLYTMMFDFLVLILSTVGLLRLPGRSGFGLWHLLLRDGLFYFVVAASVNAMEVVFILLNLNPVMNVIVSVPAAAVTATVACRSFVRLNTFNSQDTSGHTRGAKTGGAKTGAHLVKTIGGHTVGGGAGVHVQMDTFVSQHPGAVSFHPGGDAESQTDKPRGYGDSDYEDEK